MEIQFYALDNFLGSAQSAGVLNASTQTLAICVLQYLGNVGGINMIEGVGCLFYWIATRMQKLEERGWLINSRRERVLGADDLAHERTARYVFKKRRIDVPDAQGAPDLEGRP